MRQKLIAHIKRKGVRDQHDAETIAHDVLSNPKALGVEFKDANFKVMEYFRVKQREDSRTESLDAPSEEDLTLYDAMIYDDFNERKTAQQVTQRQLINKLADGSDERTTLIVQTFLNSDKPTVTNVAKRLGLDHKQVSRSLAKLAFKYSEDKFGYLGDYFNECADDLIA